MCLLCHGQYRYRVMNIVGSGNCQWHALTYVLSYDDSSAECLCHL